MKVNGGPFSGLIIIVGIIVLMMVLLVLAMGGEYGGVVMIGPIPIVFGSNYRWAILAMVLAIILMVVALVFVRLIEDMMRGWQKREWEHEEEIK